MSFNKRLWFLCLDNINYMKDKTKTRKLGTTTKTCKKCNNKFKTKHNADVYCCECRKLKCEVCLKIYYNSRAIKRNSKYCSKKCFQLSMVGRKQTEKSNKKRSISLKLAYKEGRAKVVITDEIKKKMSISRKGQFLGNKHPMWKGGITKHSAGYIMRYCFGHPRSYKNRVYEHILVMEKKIGRYLKPKEVVHHINKIRDDNREENLMLFDNNSNHLKYHRDKINKII